MHEKNLEEKASPELSSRRNLARARRRHPYCTPRLRGVKRIVSSYHSLTCRVGTAHHARRRCGQTCAFFGGQCPPYEISFSPHPGPLPSREREDAGSFPLDRRRRLGADVVHHAVHALHFVDDPRRNAGQQVVGQVAPVGRHEILGLDRPNGQGVFIGPRRRPSRPRSAPAAARRRPGTSADTSPAALISSTTIASAWRSVSSRDRVTSPRQRTARPGPGNGCRQTMSSGNPSCSPSLRTSSLNRSRSGSMSLKPRSSGRPPTLWCSLIVAAGPSGGAAFDHVGIQACPGPGTRRPDPGGLVGKAFDEGVADPLRAFPADR